MKSAGTLSALVTVLAAALIGITPISSHAAVYTPDSHVESGSDSNSNPPQCSLGHSANGNSCSNTGTVQTFKAGDLTRAVESDQQPAFEQADATTALLEDLIKSGVGRAVEEL